MRKKLIFVSNRLPVTVEKKRGAISYKQSMGGLATGLGSFYHSFNSIWTGWCGIPKESLTQGDRKEIESTLLNEYRCDSLYLTNSEVKLFYHGFCNKTIWPLFHYFPNYTVYEKSFWQSYVRVNEKYCEAVLKHAGPEDTIWVHDYQLLLLPKLIRERLPKAKIGFFLHIPFPSFEIFRLLPWRREILEGLLGADLVGFHTFDYVRHFLSSVRRLLGYEHTLGRILAGNRLVRADVFPMGIDFERYAGAVKDQKVIKEIERIKKKLGNQRAVLSVDRLDYTKGILQRLKSFDHFLRTNPKFHGKVTLILVAVPSRTGVDTYMQLKRELDEQVGRINGKYGRIGWMPVWYLYRSLPFHTLSALYALSEVGLVTPLRDGMNLIAKEYIAARAEGGGTLILSGMAGAVHELSEAFIVNPNNIEQVSHCLKDALELPVEEQRKLNKTMQDRLKRYNVVRWAQDFIERLDTAYEQQKQFTERRLTPLLRKKLLQNYERASRRLLFFDYDGTVMPFTIKPDKAAPDKFIQSLFKRLSESEKNELVIMSGRHKEIMSRWFQDLKVGMIAEHGAWLKQKEGDWYELEPLREEWKEEIRPVFELYMDRTPGSFIEEKSYSIVWHYRRADPDLAELRVNELKETLIKLTENLNLGILEGNRVIEVKTAGINKGTASLHWVQRSEWDFTMAVGDDVTDEDAFEVLGPHAYSIKVGVGVTKARFNIPDVESVRKLLVDMAER
jgi:trehalose 6-phosphate synthase/phosphatase